MYFLALQMFSKLSLLLRLRMKKIRLYLQLNKEIANRSLKQLKPQGLFFTFPSLPGYSAAGSVPRSGRGGRAFESPYPDYFFKPD